MKILPASLLASVSAAGFVFLMAGSANAEMGISVYGGVQGATDSDVSVSGTGAQDFTASWEGKSFGAPPYYGVRGTWWLDDFGYSNWGVALDYTHTKVYADDSTKTTAGFTHFEFTDGLNLLTLNALYRMPLENTKFTPYVGLGAGVNIPHVEVDRTSTGGSTFDYQLGGATLQAQAGVSYQFAEHWSAFAEYKGNYSWVDVDIDSGSSLKTEIFTNAINVGLTFHW
ncbi:outer membrane protein [Agrobacterium sp. ES01]|uniref:outer membrane protein n=1 Tax=Agrobacterium sp. ES01 TaxID=3420714 RepID=UPI003D0C44E8